METNRSLNRRDFLKTGLLSFAGVLMLPSCLKDYKPFAFFTLEEAALLSSICERIIPEDELGPGATQAGVIYYIDKQISSVFSNKQDDYRNGLGNIRISCSELYSSAFEDLDETKQIEFLERMEKNDLEGEYWENNSPGAFFSMMVRHSMQGFYGAPRHGGNKNYISYKMLDLDYPYVVGQNRYREAPLYK